MPETPAILALLSRIADRLDSIEAKLGSTAPAPAPANACGIREAAQRLGCSREHLRRLVARGEVKGQRLGKIITIPLAEMERLIVGGLPTRDTNKSAMPSTNGKANGYLAHGQALN